MAEEAGVDLVEIAPDGAAACLPHHGHSASSSTRKPSGQHEAKLKQKQVR